MKINNLKSLKIQKRRKDNTMAKGKRTNDCQRNTTEKTKDLAARTSLRSGG